MKELQKIQILWAMMASWLGTQPAFGQEAQFFRLAGPVPTTITAVSPNGVITWTNSATNTTFTVQTAMDLSVESNWVDYVAVPSSNAVTALRVFDPDLPAGMVLIPAGSFLMGDTFSEGNAAERPTHTVYVSAFHMDRVEVTKALWDEVKVWSMTNSYLYENDGQGQAADHPAQSVNWWDCVKWCNARSEKQHLTPCYYTDVNLTTVYRGGRVNPYAKWDASGYRLPTEAEWEKAARGGAREKRFPWGQTIDHSHANYLANGAAYSYDISPYSINTHHPDYNVGYFTSPVGSFPPNGYGLHAMVGNVEEWCWDWSAPDYYSISPSVNPRGPGYTGYRVGRGGSHSSVGEYCRTASRHGVGPANSSSMIGFRCVRVAE